MLAKVLERRVPREGVTDQRSRRLGQEDLATVAGRHDARGPMDIHADIDVVGQLRFACVDADPDLYVGAVGPRLGGDRALDANRGPDGVAGSPEHGEERVALRPDLGAATIAGLTNELVMPREHRSVVGPELLDELRRALDIGEHEGGGSGRQRCHRSEFRPRPRNDKQPPDDSHVAQISVAGLMR